MAISSTQVSCTTTPAVAYTADNDGCMLYLHHQGGGVIWLGGSDLTTSNGLSIDSATDVVAIRLTAGDVLYARSGTGTEVLQILVVN
jgi:hypothetical protein